MGLFSKKATPLAAQGNGAGTVILTFPGGSAVEVPVVGLDHHWDAAVSLAGKRPRDDAWREKNLKIRLVREPENPHDANAIAVVSDTAGHIGYVPRSTAEELAPGLDGALRQVAKRSSGSGASVDFYASARLEADWDELQDLGPDDDRVVASSVDIVLRFDGKWQAKITDRPT